MNSTIDRQQNRELSSSTSSKASNHVGKNSQQEDPGNESWQESHWMLQLAVRLTTKLAWCFVATINGAESPKPALVNQLKETVCEAIQAGEQASLGNYLPARSR